jgi:hypothetical protein
MASTFSKAIMDSKLSIVMNLGGVGASGEVDTLNDLDETVIINSASTPDGAYGFVKRVTGTGSAVTIDFLDALADVEGNVITMAAQKVRAIKFKAPTTNAGNTTITVGATNALLLGGAAFSWILSPGQSLLAYLENDGVTIDATHCNVDVTGTLSDVLDVAIVCG